MARLINALEQLFSSEGISSGPSLLISYSSASGSFSVGETVTGGTSGATVVVKSSISPQITGSEVTGTFQVGETITGGTSGATATVDNFFLYDFPSGAAPLENGLIDFFESGSSTVRKTTYSDAGETLPNPNPVVIGGDGRVPDIYGTGNYRIVVRTSTGVQILARDPVGSDSLLIFGSSWASTITYSFNDVVREAGKYWKSKVNNNINFRPSTDTTGKWVEVEIIKYIYDSIVDLSNADTSIGSVYLNLGDKSGSFFWSNDDLSAQVALDINQGVYIAPSGDPTGASGAWVRNTDYFGRMEVRNDQNQQSTLLDIFNFARQGQGSEPTAAIVHHYTDATLMQLDNVGDGDVLVLKNAQNATNRPDRPSNYVGTGRALVVARQDASAGFSRDYFFISQIGEVFFTGEGGIAKIVQNKDEDSTYAFSFETSSGASKAHRYLLRLLTNDQTVFSFENDVSNTRAAIASGSGQANGLFISASTGPLLLDAQTDIRANSAIKGNGASLTLGSTSASSGVEFQTPMQPRNYTSTGSLPSASTFQGNIVMYNSVPAYSNGINWKYVRDDTIII